MKTINLDLKKTSESFSLKSKLLWINSPQIEIKKYPKVIKIRISNRCSCGHANLSIINRITYPMRVVQSKEGKERDIKIRTHRTQRELTLP